MQEIVLTDRVIWAGNIYEIRRQIIKQMNKYQFVKDLIAENLH